MQIEQAVGLHGRRLPLQSQRLELLVPDRFSDQNVRSLAEQDLSLVRRLLQARGDVDGVAGDERLARAGDDLPGVDTDPNSETERSDSLSYLVRSPHGAQGIVLVGPRDPEHTHGGIAYELLDPAAVPLEDRAGLRVAAAHQLAQELGVCAVAERGRAYEVAEENGNDLADRRRLGGERRGAGVAEARPFRVLLTALGAAPHDEEPRTGAL